MGGLLGYGQLERFLPKDAIAAVNRGPDAQLSSGSWRIKVYAGTGPLTGPEIRLSKHAGPNGRRRSKSASCSSRPRQDATNGDVTDLSIDEIRKCASGRLIRPGQRTSSTRRE
jgi:hypothetical protein